MPHLRHWLTSALLVSTMTAAWGTRASVAAPPNAAPAQTEPARAGALDARADARLAQVVPMTVRGEPLGDALKALTERSGVRLEATRDVADLKVTVLARELPLQRGLAEVAGLLDLTWTRRGTAPAYRYECARSLAATQRARAALEQARVTNRATVLAQLSRIAAAVGKGDTAGLAATDPQVAGMLNDPNRGEGARQVFQYLSHFPPQAMQALVQQGSLTTGYEQMPPESREMVRRATESFLPLALANVRGPDGNSPGYENFVKSASYTLGVGGLDYGGNSYFGEMRAGGVSIRFSLDLGASTVPPPDAGAPGTGAAPGAATPARVRRPLPPIPAVLESKKPLSVHEIVDWLAEKTPFTVVSDYYATRYERPLVPVPSGAHAEAVLAALEKYAEMEYTVSGDDEVLRLRSRRWPLDDLMEPLPAAVEALESALKANKGRLGLSEYLLAAQLTDAQNAGLGRIDAQKYGPLSRTLDGSRPLIKDGLRLTATLTPGQRAAAESPAGLPILHLAPAQRALIAAVATRQKGDLQPEEIAAAVLKFRREDRSLPAAGAAPGTVGAALTETYIFSVTLPSRGGAPGEARPTTISASLALGPVPAQK